MCVSIFIPLLREHDEPLNKRSATCDSPSLPLRTSEPCVVET